MPWLLRTPFVSPAARVAVALLSLAIATAARFLLDDWLGARAPFAFFTLATLVTVLFSGAAAGLLVAIAGTLVGLGLFVGPITADEWLVAGNFLAGCTIAVLVIQLLRRDLLQTSALAEQMRGARERLEKEVETRRRAEQALGEAQERLLFALDAAELVIWQWNSRDGQVVCSPGARHLLGLQSGSVHDFTARVHPEDLPRVRERYEQATHTTRAFDVEFRYWRDDTWRWLAIRGRVEDAGGSERRVTGISMDITDRKAAEQKLQEATERFRLIVDNALDYAIFTFDLAGRFTSWNPGAEQILLYKAEEVLGRDCRILWTAADRVARAPETEMNRALTEGRAEDNRWHVRKGGTQFFAAGVVVPLRNATGEVSGFLKIMRDETERKHAEEELTRYRERLEELVVERTQALRLSLMNLRRSERLASLGTLAAGIAHEINNPLNAILMLAEYARQNPADTSHNETYRMIIEQTIRCSTIVKGILQFARDEKTPKAPNQINPVLVRACELAKTYVHGEGLWIDLDLADNLPPVVMNTTEIEQVIVNLIKNAAQAAASLGGEVRVVVRSTLQDDHVRISVEDNGPGIDPQYLPQIFDPFFSTTRHAGGTGLGLSITHGIVTEHGGEITVESELGRGTTFLVYLPVHAPSAGTPEPVEAPAPT